MAEPIKEGDVINGFKVTAVDQNSDGTVRVTVEFADESPLAKALEDHTGEYPLKGFGNVKPT